MFTSEATRFAVVSRRFTKLVEVREVVGSGNFRADWRPNFKGPPQTVDILEEPFAL